MHKSLHNILMAFQPLFSHKSTHYYFLLVMLGFLLRFDHYGVSSTIRWLGLEASIYNSLLHFFRVSPWNLGTVMVFWMNWCLHNFPVLQINGRFVCVGDGIKIPKDAERQPGVVKLHQDSSDSNKPHDFWGHHFGGIALLALSPHKCFAVPILFMIHEGVPLLRELQGEREVEKQTCVTRMILSLVAIAIKIGKPCYAALDAGFASGPAFLLAAKYVMDRGLSWIHIITKAKSSYVAYFSEEDSSSRKNGLALFDRFKKEYCFTEALHPKGGHSIEYCFFDLFWPPAKAFIRFVWVIDGGNCFVLMCSDLNLDPLEILRIYSLRSKIEVLFLVLKQIIGGFLYKFWTKSQEKLKKNKKAKEMITLPTEKDQQNQLAVLTAIERFVNLAAIMVGILQYLAITFSKEIFKIHHTTSWLRTYSSEVPSEETVQRTIQVQFFVHPRSKQITWIKKLICQKNKEGEKSGKVATHATLSHLKKSISPPDD